MTNKKKTAPEAATSRTMQLNNNLNTSITDNPEKIKVIHQAPGRISCVMSMEKQRIDKLMKAFGAHRLLDFENGCAYLFHGNILESIHHQNANVRYSNKVYYGECYVVGIAPVTTDSKTQNYDYVSLTAEQIQTARAWLLKHSV